MQIRRERKQERATNTEEEGNFHTHHQKTTALQASNERQHPTRRY